MVMTTFVSGDFSDREMVLLFVDIVLVFTVNYYTVKLFEGGWKNLYQVTVFSYPKIIIAGFRYTFHHQSGPHLFV